MRILAACLLSATTLLWSVGCDESMQPVDQDTSAEPGMAPAEGGGDPLSEGSGSTEGGEMPAPTTPGGTP